MTWINGNSTSFLLSWLAAQNDEETSRDVTWVFDWIRYCVDATEMRSVCPIVKGQEWDLMRWPYVKLMERLRLTMVMYVNFSFFNGTMMVLGIDQRSYMLQELHLQTIDRRHISRTDPLTVPVQCIRWANTDVCDKLRRRMHTRKDIRNIVNWSSPEVLW